MKRHAENRMRMLVHDDGSIHPPEDDIAELRGNAEPACDAFAREDAAREAAMKRIPAMVAGGRVHAEVWKSGAA